MVEDEDTQQISQQIGDHAAIFHPLRATYWMTDLSFARRAACLCCTTDNLARLRLACCVLHSLGDVKHGLSMPRESGLNNCKHLCKCTGTSNLAMFLCHLSWPIIFYPNPQFSNKYVALDN